MVASHSPQDQSRVILHVDMDAFFASVEQRDNVALRGRPVAVGGLTRGVVAAASYEARKFGVHSAMPMRQALARCPDLHVVSPRREAYEAASQAAFAVFARYTPQIEPLSLDEAFLDVTGSVALFGDGATIAAQIRQAIAESVNLPSSAGVACNKFVAKLACDMGKPCGLKVVPSATMRTFLSPLPIERIYGVGEVAKSILHRSGIRTMQDAVSAGPDRLVALLGAHGRTIHALAQGIDPRPVVSDACRKSISAESTLDEDVYAAQDLHRELLQHALRVATRLGQADLHAMGIQIKLKDSAFRVETRQAILPHPTRDPDSLYQAAVTLMGKIRFAGRGFRLCGLGAFDLRPGPPPRQLFVEPGLARRESLESARQRITDRFGTQALTRATLVGIRETKKGENDPA
jgi:DNA polymerase-4